MSVKVTACPAGLFRPALELLYHRPDLASGAPPVQAVERQLEPADVVIATSGQQVLGVIVAQSAPGGVGWIWPPVLGPRGTSESLDASAVASMLVREAVAQLSRSGLNLAQALLLPDSPDGKYLQEGGFRHVTDIIRMSRRCAREGGGRNQVELEFLPYSSHFRKALRQVIEQSYQGSLDCPELNGLRSVEDVIDSYRSGDPFRPELWLLGRRNDQFVGCVLLRHLGDLPRCEVQYMGVIPAARRQGVGLALLRQAIQLARSVGAFYLGLSVDVRNHPARSLYKALEFRQMDRRALFLFHPQLLSCREGT